MKLHELGARRPTEQIAQVIESHSGNRIDFDRLSPQKAQSMLKRVRGLIKEHRKSPSFHYSERNPDYTKLVMLEQALSQMAEQVPAMMPATAAGNVPTQVDPMAAAKLKAVTIQRKRQLQDAIKQKQQEIAAMQKQMASPTLGIAESLRRTLRESELQQAQVVLAAQDMIDRVQKMLEQISEMQFKDLPALTDTIKQDMGPEQASQFQSQAAQALNNLLTAVQQGKTELESAQGVLTGQAPTVPGVDASADLDVELPADGDADLDADLSLDANLPVDDEEENVPSVRALGREKR